jgi:hypothetical protein
MRRTIGIIGLFVVFPAGLAYDAERTRVGLSPGFHGVLELAGAFSWTAICLYLIFIPRDPE